MKHIAICVQPFFDLIVSGEKTIESRWSNRKIAPYNKVKKGDIIYLKESGKDVFYMTTVKDYREFELTEEIADQIKREYSNEIKIDLFKNWEECRHKKYLTLIWLNKIEPICQLKVKKSNGAGWLILGE